MWSRVLLLPPSPPPHPVKNHTLGGGGTGKQGPTAKTLNNKNSVGIPQGDAWKCEGLWGPGQLSVTCSALMSLGQRHGSPGAHLQGLVAPGGRDVPLSWVTLGCLHKDLCVALGTSEPGEEQKRKPGEAREVLSCRHYPLTS